MMTNLQFEGEGDMNARSVYQRPRRHRHGRASRLASVAELPEAPKSGKDSPSSDAGGLCGEEVFVVEDLLRPSIGNRSGSTGKRDCCSNCGLVFDGQNISNMNNDVTAGDKFSQERKEYEEISSVVKCSNTFNDGYSSVQYNRQQVEPHRQKYPRIALLQNIISNYRKPRHSDNRYVASATTETLCDCVKANDWEGGGGGRGCDVNTGSQTNRQDCENHSVKTTVDISCSKPCVGNSPKSPNGGHFYVRDSVKNIKDKRWSDCESTIVSIDRKENDCRKCLHKKRMKRTLTKECEEKELLKKEGAYSSNEGGN